MMFESESDLVESYQQYLNYRGIPTELEVSCGRGFAADLVSSTTVWEAKLILTRESLYQAFGQAESYRVKLNKPQAAIFGLTPPEARTARQSERIADWLKQIHSHLWIIFIDTDSLFTQFYHDAMQSRLVSRSVIDTRI
jgi:hypothetical protein